MSELLGCPSGPNRGPAHLGLQVSNKACRESLQRNVKLASVPLPLYLPGAASWLQLALSDSKVAGCSA